MIVECIEYQLSNNDTFTIQALRQVILGSPFTLLLNQYHRAELYSKKCLLYRNPEQTLAY